MIVVLGTIICFLAYIGNIVCNVRKRYRNQTELKKYIWKLKEKEVELTITWKKLRQSNICQRRSVFCNLCLEEKVERLLRQANPSKQLTIDLRCQLTAT